MEEQLKALIKEAVKEALQEMNFSQPKEVLNVKELCKWLGVSPAWVSANKDKLNIPHFKMGGDKFYRSDIEKWIEENKKNVVYEKGSIREVSIKPAKSKSRIY